jgi:hypothetical protein
MYGQVKHIADNVKNGEHDSPTEGGRVLIKPTYVFIYFNFDPEFTG